MDIAMDNRPPSAGAALLAGLQAGMSGALWMMAYMGLAALWKHLSFWTYENLFATFFYRGGALQPGFSMRTVAGMALIIVVYTAFGGLFAIAARQPRPRLRTLLLGVLFGVAWYYISFRLLWKSAIPLAAMLHPERPTIVAHVVYGLALGRFPAYLEKPAGPGTPVPAAAPESAEPAEPSATAATVEPAQSADTTGQPAPAAAEPETQA